MPKIENWGLHYENEVMKGYVLYALKMIAENEPELKLSDARSELGDVRSYCARSL